MAVSEVKDGPIGRNGLSGEHDIVAKGARGRLLFIHLVPLPRIGFPAPQSQVSPDRATGSLRDAAHLPHPAANEKHVPQTQHIARGFEIAFSHWSFLRPR